MLIDTHCHLNFKAFKGKVPEILASAEKNGVEKIIAAGARLNSSRKAIKLAENYPQIYAGVGIHPHHAVEFKDQTENKIKTSVKKVADHKRVVAIGECGLDYYQYQNTKYKDYQISKKFKITQQKVLRAQFKAAEELDLPLIIHNRKASKDLLKFVKNWPNKNITGVFHCFQGATELWEWIIDNNFYLGITGIVTFNRKMAEIAEKTPLQRLLIETDGPFLAPEVNGKRLDFPNKPENVKIVAQKIAELKKISFAEVAEATTLNTEKLFNLS
jgi:TatD DNase family protein